MPTKKWMEEHKMVTFWVSPAEHEALKAACAAKKPPLSMAKALRATVQAVLLLSENGGPDA